MPSGNRAAVHVRQLARALPDRHVWIDTRGMLLSGEAIVTGGDSVEPGFVAQLFAGPRSVVSVVGHPAREAIAKAVEGATDMTPVFAHRDNAEHVAAALGGCPPSSAGMPWTPERVLFFQLTDPAVDEPAGGDAPLRMLSAHDPIDHLPPGLRFEIGHARATEPVAAAVVAGKPVAFCYPCWTTESLWDLSIDTLEAYRRRGLAQRLVRFMIGRMRERGREPVWGALESNVASLQLARKLGFSPVDDNVVFSRGPWAYLTRGFTGM